MAVGRRSGRSHSGQSVMFTQGFKLSDGADVFLTFAPSLFCVFEADVGRCERPTGGTVAATLVLV